MRHVAEGEESPDGDDDKIYLFFSETAVEYDSYNKLDVSRVARVCKVLFPETGCSLANITEEKKKPQQISQLSLPKEKNPTLITKVKSYK